MLALFDGCREGGVERYLIAAGTRAEALVAEIEFFDTERAGLLLVIVDELIL